MPQPRLPTRRSDVVSASEIASFIYCPEQWRLQCALGNRPQNVESLARGESFHRETARFDVWSRRLLRLGVILVVLALLVVIIAVRFRWLHP